MAVRAYLVRMALDEKPILVGPWRSEVGFEALYWLPFLKWCATHVPNFWGRMVTVTRGGAHVLYQTAPPYPERVVDLYALRSVTEVRRENLYDWTKTKLQKQTRCTDWDRAVLRDAADRVLGKGARYHVLHPSWMYWALAPFWDEDRGLKYLLSMTDYAPIQKPSVAQWQDNLWSPNATLPERFVAMKFYGRATFPYPHPETAAFVSQVAGIVSAQIPVVLLNSGHTGDDHRDVPVSGQNIHHLPVVAADQNLALQAAVIGKATAFVGTYGGVAQLALRMGIPSCSFYTTFEGTATAHLALSAFLSQRTKVPFLTGSIADAQLWRQVITAPMAQAIAA